MNHSSILAAGFLLPALAASSQDKPQKPSLPQNPNIIIILADDLGYGDLECYGTKNVKTPHVNRLAERGIQFTNTHAAASTSTPSRTRCSPVNTHGDSPALMWPLAMRE